MAEYPAERRSLTDSLEVLLPHIAVACADALAAHLRHRHLFTWAAPVTRALTNCRELSASAQAHAVIAAALLRHLHAVVTTGQAWDPLIATHGHRSAALTIPMAA